MAIDLTGPITAMATDGRIMVMDMDVVGATETRRRPASPNLIAELNRSGGEALGKVACRHRISLPTRNPARVLGRVAGFLVCHAIRLGRG